MDADRKEEKEIGAEAAEKKKVERAEKRAAGEKMRNVLLCSLTQRKGAAAAQRALPSPAVDADGIIELLSRGACESPSSCSPFTARSAESTAAGPATTPARASAEMRIPAASPSSVDMASKAEKFRMFRRAREAEADSAAASGAASVVSDDEGPVSACMPPAPKRGKREEFMSAILTQMKEDRDALHEESRQQHEQMMALIKLLAGGHTAVRAQPASPPDP